jgi:hypothetical protein
VSHPVSESHRESEGLPQTRHIESAEAELADWRQDNENEEDDCCDSDRNGLVPPTLWFEVEANTDGDRLVLRPKFEHPCGIKSYWFRVAIFEGDHEPSDSWHTEVEKSFGKNGPEAPSPEFRGGPGEDHRLPVDLIGMTVGVDGLVISECSTSVTAHAQFRLVVGPY